MLISSNDESINSASKRGKKKGDKRRKKGSQEKDEDELETLFSVVGKDRVEKEMEGIDLAHITKISERMNGWIREIEKMRRSSKNMKGSFSGKMKILLECCKRTVDKVATRVVSEEDPIYWKNKVISLTEENNRLQCRLGNLEREMEMLKHREQIREAYNKKTSSKCFFGSLFDYTL